MSELLKKGCDLQVFCLRMYSAKEIADFRPNKCKVKR